MGEQPVQRQLTVTLDDEVLAVLEAESKEDGGATFAQSILVSAVSKHFKKAKVGDSDTAGKPPPKPQIDPVLAAVIGKLNTARWVMSELLNSSDRSAAIVGGAFVDDSLCGLLKEYWKKRCSPPTPASVEKATFEFPGPLSSFSARITVARASGLIGPSTHSDLNAIRDIRNACAHWTMSRTSDEFVPVSFEDEEIRNWCDALVFANGFDMAFVGGQPVMPSSPRDKFILTASMLSHQLVGCTIGVLNDHLDQKAISELLP